MIITALLAAPQMGLAAQIVRQASAKIVVYKTTMTMVNGKYTSTETKVCENVKQFPVTDERLAGDIPVPSDLSYVCDSTVQNKPVVIATTPLTWISETDKIPWKSGKNVALKGLGVISYVYAKDQANPPKNLQETLRANSFSEDLGLKEIGFALAPFIEFKSESCSSIEAGAPSSKKDCEPKQSVNLEEYFTVFVYIEDKNI